MPFKPETREIWTDASDSYTPFVEPEYGRATRRGDRTFTGNKVTLWRWRDDFQNDFAARMDWCIASYEEANHPPVPELSHADEVTVASGDTLRLEAGESTDPDGDSLSYVWFNYAEAGSLKEEVIVNQPGNTPTAWAKMPEVEETETTHFILRVTDKGSPPLSTYRRVVVTIAPK